MLASPMILLLLLQQAGAKPVKTTVEKLQAGALRPGARVEVAAVLLPLTAIQVQTGAGPIRYFALAVSPEGAFLKQAALTLDEVKAAAPAAIKELEEAVDDDARYKAKVDEVDKLESRLSKLAPAAAEALAVELQGFEPAARGYNWQTIVGKGADASLRAASTSDRPSFSVADSLERIKKLAEENPPNLSQPLPRYAGSKLFSTRAELKAHRKMVRQFNDELMRRRRYAVKLSIEDLELAQARVARMLSFREQTLVGAVIAKDELAARTFTKSSGGVPGAWLREAAPKGQTVVDRHFTKTSLLVASYPSGAVLSVGGKSIGSTPTLVPDLAVGSEAALAVERPGFARKEQSEKLAPVPSGVKRVELTLVSTAPPVPEPDEAWFAETSGSKLTVTQEADVEWASPDGKSKSRAELILRCAGGEKEVYLYSANGFGAREGDLFIKFEDEAKPKKYWGAPSQNGLSYFFTGFWGKGTDGVIKAFLAHKTMTLTVKPKKKEPLPELSFDMRGLDVALADWLKACPLKK